MSSWWAIGVGWLLACTPEDPPVLRPDPPELSVDSRVEVPPNDVLILLTDDQGTDKVGIYADHAVPPPTPNIDALALRGRLFRRAYASPVCSPGRASILTGRMPRRTGVGEVLQTYMETQLPLSEVLLPELLAGADPPWANAALGKWHLAGFESPSGRNHPNDQGFDRFAGTLGNLYDTQVMGGPKQGYYDWEKVTDGVPARERRYATTVTVDDAVDAIATLPEPWLVYVAFNAPHEPLEPPPVQLSPTFGAVPADSPPEVRYHAVVEALDTEIGRLLGSIDPEVLERTTVIFLSDNGTPGHAVLPPLNPARAKVTVFEGGIRIPMIIAGPLVEQPGTETSALVHAVDLFPTIAEIAGVAVDPDIPIDGTSLLPLLADADADWPRTVVHSERFQPLGPRPPLGYWQDTRTSSDDAFKVIELATIDEVGFFDVRDGLDDGLPLPASAFEGADREHVDALLEAHNRYWDGLTLDP